MEAAVLNRYQWSLVKLLGRGVDYIRTVEHSVLADLGFQAVLQLHEQLERTQVIVDAERQPLVERSTLLSQKLRLLDAYLRERHGRDPGCLATARIQLGLCLNERERWQPLDWETLESIAYARGVDILAASADVARAAGDAAVDAGEMTLLIKPYAARASWDGFAAEAEEYLDEVDCGEDPFPWVFGSARYRSELVSPAWTLAGYGAVAGFRDRRTYGILVHNRTPSATYDFHAVLVEPTRSRMNEAMRRAAGGVWLARHYWPIIEANVRRVGEMGPEAIRENCQRSSLEPLAHEHHPLWELLHAAGVASPERR